MAKLTTQGGTENSMNQLLQPGQLKHDDERTQWLQSLRFLVDRSLIYSIWLSESNRRANMLTFVQFPTIFCILALRFSIGVISPCYYFLHFVFSRIDKFAAADARLTNVPYTRTVLPLVLLHQHAGFLGLNKLLGHDRQGTVALALAMDSATTVYDYDHPMDVGQNSTQQSKHA